MAASLLPWFPVDRIGVDYHYAPVDAGRVIGWVASLGRIEQARYAGGVEHSVYVDRDARGKASGGSCSAP